MLLCTFWRALIIASADECLVSKQAFFLSCQHWQYEVLTIQKEMSSALHKIKKINGKYRYLLTECTYISTSNFCSPSKLVKMLLL